MSNSFRPLKRLSELEEQILAETADQKNSISEESSAYTVPSRYSLKGFATIFLATFMGAMNLQGCSGNSTKPEPDPQDIFFDVKGEAFPYDLPEPVRIIASHPDGFADASIEVYLNDDQLFAKNEQSIGARFDTTFTPQADAPGQLRVEYFLQANADVADAQGSRSIEIQDTPFAQASISFYDAVTRQPIDGTVTDQETGSSYEIADGLWSIHPTDQIRKTDLAQGLEVLIESENRLPTLDIAVGEDREHYQIPFTAPNFSFDEFYDFMYEFPIFMERGDDRMTRGYPMGAEVDVYVGDRSTWEDRGDGFQRYTTDDENYWIADGFKQDVIDMFGLFEDFIPSNNGLETNLYVQSESDVDFPTALVENSFMVSTTPETPFSVERLSRQDEGKISSGYMLQKVFPDRGPIFPESLYAACEEIIESFSALNTSANVAVLCDDDGPTAKAAPFTRASLSLPPGSSINYSSSATSADGTSIRPIYVVKRE